MWDKINTDEGQANKLLSEGMKHGNQQTNIVNKMSQGNLLNCQGEKEIIYVEYGAGKAGLSSFVAQELGAMHTKEPFEKSKLSFLVIDRDSRRFKKDKYVKAAGFVVERQKIDIADFDLVKYTQLKIKEDIGAPKVIGIAKHLCGGATDLALTSFEKLPGA